MGTKNCCRTRYHQTCLWFFFGSVFGQGWPACLTAWAVGLGWSAVKAFKALFTHGRLPGEVTDPLYMNR